LALVERDPDAPGDFPNSGGDGDGASQMAGDTGDNGDNGGAS